jgi:hypothetical protein
MLSFVCLSVCSPFYSKSRMKLSSVSIFVFGILAAITDLVLNCSLEPLQVPYLSLALAGSRVVRSLHGSEELVSSFGIKVRKITESRLWQCSNCVIY